MDHENQPTSSSTPSSLYETPSPSPSPSSLCTPTSTTNKRRLAIHSAAARRAASHNRKRTKDIATNEEVRFSELMLHPSILKGLTEAGYEKPSPIQLKAIPLGRFGVDLLAQAKSGTGKTCVFGVIALEAANPKADPGEVQVLALAPTREVAIQTSDVIKEIGKYMTGIGVHTCIGGLPLHVDVQALKSSSCQIVVGTPGRIQQLLASGALRADSIRLLILDEADLLFEKGSFRHVIDAIFKAITTGDLSLAAEQSGLQSQGGGGGGSGGRAMKRRKTTEDDEKEKEKEGEDSNKRQIQVLSLSATYSEELLSDLAKNFMKDPQYVLLNSDSPSLEGVTQYIDRLELPGQLQEEREGEGRGTTTTTLQHNNCYSLAPFETRIVRTMEILSKLSFYQCIIFCNEKNRAQETWERLEASGWPSSFIAGGQDQQQRNKAMEKLRNFEIRVLVSTDLTARGIDLDRINLVINIQIPKNADTYLHRVGRTGRFGTFGVAITLIGGLEDQQRMEDILELTKAKMEPFPKDCRIPEDTYVYQLPLEEERKALKRLVDLQTIRTPGI